MFGVGLGNIGKLGMNAISAKFTEIMNVFSNAPVYDSSAGNWKFEGGDFDAVVGNQQVLKLDGIDDYCESGNYLATPVLVTEMYFKIYVKIGTLGTKFLFSLHGVMERGEAHLNTNGSIRFIPYTGCYIDAPAATVSLNEICELEFYTNSTTSAFYIKKNGITLSAVKTGTITSFTPTSTNVRVGARFGANGYFTNFKIINFYASINGINYFDCTFNSKNGLIIYNNANLNNNLTIYGSNESASWDTYLENIKPFALVDGFTAYKNNTDATKYINVVGNNSLTITDYTKEAYYAPGSGMVKALPNTVIIPTNTTLNAILAAGTYTWDQLNALIQTNYLRITKLTYQIQKLIVRIK